MTMSAVSGAGNLSQLAFELILQPSLLEPKVLAPNRGETKDKLPRGVPDEVNMLRLFHEEDRRE